MEKKSVISFDVSSDDAFLAAGTAQVVEDAFLLFWDVRYHSGSRISILASYVILYPLLQYLQHKFSP